MKNASDRSHDLVTLAVLGLLAAAFIASPATALADPKPGPWAPPEMALLVDGEPVTGGCPHESPNGRHLYTARGADGTLDVWIYDRKRAMDAFAGPFKLEDPISLGFADDFCPTPFRNTVLYFVSDRGTCGMGDIFKTWWHPARGWQEPEELGCGEDGPNTAGGEFSPSVVRTDEGLVMYYSSNGTGNHDIYRSLRVDGKFGKGEPVAELNTEFDDRMPNVDKYDTEIVFSSARPSPGEANPTQDVFVATRPNVNVPWSNITNLSETTPFGTVDQNETRVTMSKDRKRLYYGADGIIYTSTRDVKEKKHKCTGEHEHVNGKCKC